MADDEKKPKGDNGSLTKYTAEIAGMLLLLYIVGNGALRLFGGFNSFVNNRGVLTEGGGGPWDGFLSSLFYFFTALIVFLTIFSNIVSTLLLMGII